MKVGARRARVSTESDGISGAPAVIVNEAFAAKAWPGEDPLGQRIRLVRGRTPQPLMTVVGVVPEIQQAFRRPLERAPLFYLPYTLEPLRVIVLVALPAV